METADSPEQFVISVIVPVYNAKRTLARCLDSLLAQSFAAIGILCVDDGSTDGSDRILKDYAARDPRIRLLTLPENKGPSAARNLALACAQGRYIGFADADDITEPALYERLLSAIRENGAELAVCEHTAFREAEDGAAAKGGAAAKEKAVPFSSRLLDRLTPDGVFTVSSPDDLGFLLSNIPDFIWDKLFDARAVRALGLRFPEDRAYGEDTLFLAEYLCAVKRAAFVREPLYRYNAYSAGSVTNTMNNRWYDIYANLGDLIEFFKERERREDFEALSPWLCDLSARAYDHRANALHRYGDKGFQLRFIRFSFAFLSRYFPDWKTRMRRHPDVRHASVKTNLFLMRLYILLPNAVKGALIE
ncbi:MAG: glycosyltransferase [Clostridiales bacterium]|nr:glycosyltransferase [Clostridiales bacterium]